ncbi:cupin domain-containing protein [Mycolicibacterium sp. P9-22]|uniref:cupin domain-containing protein n=1 Tax=Mycolicibacterium sp. P9-22 TaxID=2024613 RepID=UPI0011EC21F9|nr:cupin domain-containing protein [Mycolicibacterium sp. P9-22]KAA0111014.1 DUF861 domain-containing protein [Mycolicibacterium sp. P9-22]
MTVAKLAQGAELAELLTASAYVLPENLRGGDPNETGTTHLASADGRFLIGSWRAEPYSEYIEAYPGDEYTRVLEGRVTLTDDAGNVQSYGPGEAFTIAAGWRGEYRVEQTLLKQFAYYEIG